MENGLAGGGGSISAGAGATRRDCGGGFGSGGGASGGGGAFAGGSAPGDFGTVLATVMANLGLKPLAVNIGLVPGAWHRITPCMRTTISYMVECEIIDIDVATTVDVVLGGEAYPAGDRVASFRVLNPRRYRFILRHEHNPACCQGLHVVPPVEQSDWFPEAERDFKIEIGPGYEWKWKWSLSPGLQYNLYEGEGVPQPDAHDSLRREIDDLKRQLRETEERLRKSIEDGGN